MALGAAAVGALALTGCQFATGDGGAACPDNSCGGSVEIHAVKAANGGVGGTIELDLSQRVYGTPLPLFITNHLVGDVTCYAQVGTLATAVFEVDPARSTITFSASSAYAITVYDGGPGASGDGWRHDTFTGDPAACPMPDMTPGMAPATWGDGFTVGEGVGIGET